MLGYLLTAILAFIVGAGFMWFWLPYNLAHHPEKIAKLQHRSEQLMQDAGEIFDRALQAMREAGSKP